MKKNILSSIFTLIIACLSLVIQSQDLTLSQSSKSGIYRKGQKIIVKALAENLAGDTLHLKVFKNNNQLINQKTVIIGKDSLIVYEETSGKPGSIIVETKSGKENASLGMLVDPEQLKPSTRCPKDFDHYWNNLKKSLNTLPWEIKKVVVFGTESDKGYSCEDIEINCLII